MPNMSENAESPCLFLLKPNKRNHHHHQRIDSNESKFALSQFAVSIDYVLESNLFESKSKGEFKG